MISQAQSQTRSFAFSRWLLANSAGAVIGWLLGWGFGNTTGAPLVPAAFITLLILGVAQWLVLRQALKGMRWWIATNIGGIVLGVALCALALNVLAAPGKFILETLPPLWLGLHLSTQVETVFIWLILGAIAGASIGLCQWLLLKSRIERAGRWILLNAIGWSIGLGVSTFIVTIIQNNIFPLFTQGIPFDPNAMTGVLAVIITGLLTAMLTGIVLILSRQQSVSPFAVPNS